MRYSLFSRANLTDWLLRHIHFSSTLHMWTFIIVTLRVIHIGFQLKHVFVFESCPSQWATRLQNYRILLMIDFHLANVPKFRRWLISFFRVTSFNDINDIRRIITLYDDFWTRNKQSRKRRNAIFYISVFIVLINRIISRKNGDAKYLILFP